MSDFDSAATLEDTGFDASDEVQVGKKKKSAARRDREQRDFLVLLLADARGRDWLWGLLEMTHAFRTSYDPEPHRMAFLEGERNIGLRLIDEITQSAPDRFAQMLKEQGRANG